MKPIENDYEEALFHTLAPIAQKGAEEVFATWTLSQMLESWFEDKTPEEFLKRAGIPPRFWHNMLRAALVAKVSYIRPDNPQLDKAARTWLIALASTLISMPMKDYTLPEIVQRIRIKYPVLSEWMVKMATGIKA
ncbi:hypothetical protein SAMN05443662_0005 [Sulfurivirga caldicuralii]|uniref:Uncharacterized protein n=1 Tax=Sulfurivirga caldicuralii TaxID=364032 RepID=A0A1N6DBB4_9GAMM|nr:hypothetical protein [Sulfurivirga caldicuralii]SIN68060.1 hypothetical protein SAMN05443662_0005 [Sulfurivirga caldicuralii]